MKNGLIHIYCGDGKGKTTASLGLSLRAAGEGLKVLYAQFFKDGDSAEFRALEKVENITFVHPEKTFGFFFCMTDAEKREACAFYAGHLEKAIAMAKDYDLLVLDEAMSACSTGVICQERLLEFLRNKPEHLEVVLTGRDPAPEMVEVADYVTEMCKRKHPFDKGVPARPGIEY